MKTYIINRGLEYYTDMSIILNPIQEYLQDYNFLITDIECNYYPDKRINYEEDYLFISPSGLLDIVNANEIQFIWGVFSAIPKHISLEEILKYELPYSEGTRTLDEIVEIQHPLAEIEIVAFDSSYVEIINKREDVIQTIEKEFPKEKFYKKWK
jgi:predicted methyltransferase